MRRARARRSSLARATKRARSTAARVAVRLGWTALPLRVVPSLAAAATHAPAPSSAQARVATSPVATTRAAGASPATPRPRKSCARDRTAARVRLPARGTAAPRPAPETAPAVPACPPTPRPTRSLVRGADPVRKGSSAPVPPAPSTVLGKEPVLLGRRAMRVAAASSAARQPGRCPGSGCLGLKNGVMVWRPRASLPQGACVCSHHKINGH